MTSPARSHGGVDPTRVPAHVAWVAAGSDRWAAAQRAPAVEVATAEDRALLELVGAALDLGIRWLTVEDPTRGRALLATPSGELAARGIELRVLGVAGVAGVAGASGGVAEASAGGAAPDLTVTVTDGYSGHREIVGAVRALAAAGVSPDQVDERAIGAHLFSPDVPDPDLLVKTGGDRRVPDLLLWEVAYSELVFMDQLWPDVRRDHVLDAVAEYQQRVRRYGGLVAPAGRR